MSHKCPSCQRVLYDRRLKACGFCGAPIPEDLRFTPEERAELDRSVAKSEQQRRDREQLREQEEEKQEERQRPSKNSSPSNYGGIAAAFVFGVGLLIVGFSLSPAQHEHAVSMRWAGVCALALNILIVVIQGGWLSRALVTSVLAAICTAALAFSAARSEISGTTIYHHNFLNRHRWRTETVTRQEKPEMFREAANIRWALSILCAAVSIGSFVFYRKTEYDDVLSQ